MKFEKTVTPKGEARFPKLNSPNTHFKPEDPEYEVQLVLANDEVTDNYVNNLRQMGEQYLDELKNKDKKKYGKYELALPIDDELDDEGNETGRTILKCRQKYYRKERNTGNVTTRKIALYDAKGRRVNVQIGFGSLLKVGGYIQVSEMPAQKKVFVSVKPQAVQILELVSPGTGFAFGEDEEGSFVADDEELYDDEGDDNVNHEEDENKEQEQESDDDDLF